MLQKKVNCVIKRPSESWENNLVKVPRMGPSPFSPHVFNTPIDPHFVPTMSNAVLSESTCSGLSSSQISQMDVSFENAVQEMPLYSEQYNRKQIHKLNAQKITVGI